MALRTSRSVLGTNCVGGRGFSVARPVSRTRLAPCRVGDGPDAPMFSDAFKAVLAQSLARTGADMFEEPHCYEEPCRTNQEEMIINSINTSRQNIRVLRIQEKEVKASIDREKRQLDRLLTLLKLIETDAAYYRELDKMMIEREKERERQQGR